MSIRFAAAAIVLAASFSPAVADTPLGGLTSGFAAAYNSQARKSGLDTKIALSNCTDGEITTCSFEEASPIEVNSYSVKGKDDLNFLMIHYGGHTDSDAIDLMLTLNNVMRIYAADSSDDERTVTLKRIVNGVAGSLDDQKVTLHSIQFEVSNSKPFGLMIGIGGI